jgi:hypothetical protein
VARETHDGAGWQDVSEKVANAASELRMKVKPRKRFEKHFGWQAHDDHDLEDLEDLVPSEEDPD